MNSSNALMCCFQRLSTKVTTYRWTCGFVSNSDLFLRLFFTVAGRYGFSLHLFGLSNSKIQVRLTPRYYEQMQLFQHYLLNHGVDPWVFVLSSDHRGLVFITAAIWRHNRTVIQFYLVYVYQSVKNIKSMNGPKNSSKQINVLNQRIWEWATFRQKWMRS